MKIWADITQNPKTHHYVTLDLFKAVCFILGIGLTTFAALAKFFLVAMVIYFDWSTRYINIDPPLAPGLILLSFAFGMQGGKLVQTYLERLTADGNGHPLATPATAADPPPTGPELMPTEPGNPLPGADSIPLPPT